MSEKGSEIPRYITDGENTRQDIFAKLMFTEDGEVEKVIVPNNKWADYVDFCGSNGNNPLKFGKTPVEKGEVREVTLVKRS